MAIKLESLKANSMKRYCLTVDLKDDPKLIAEYELWHTKVWPEIIESIRTSGIEDLTIYRYSNRLFMIMEVNEGFSFEKKAASDLANVKVQEWEEFMWNFQQAIPGVKAGEKWVLMDKIFQL
jgi:L-rhamnose mutarotase